MPRRNQRIQTRGRPSWNTNPPSTSAAEGGGEEERREEERREEDHGRRRRMKNSGGNDGDGNGEKKSVQFDLPRPLIASDNGYIRAARIRQVSSPASLSTPSSPDGGGGGSVEETSGDGMVFPPIRTRTPGGSRRRLERENFCGRERKGDAGKAGGGRYISRALRSYRAGRVGVLAGCRRFFSFSNGRELWHPPPPQSGEPSCADQYYIPPPEESNSVIEALRQLTYGAFGDLTMWLYQSPFGKVLLFFLLLYLAFVFAFVPVIYAVECDVGPDEDGAPSPSVAARMELAFELSWTTFTTVGFGAVSPPGDASGCYPVRIVCSIEALVGLFYVALCAGIFYAKLLRVLAVAPVTFSSTLCVQYGEGLVKTKTENQQHSHLEKGSIVTKDAGWTQDAWGKAGVASGSGSGSKGSDGDGKDKCNCKDDNGDTAPTCVKQCDSVPDYLTESKNNLPPQPLIPPPSLTCRKKSRETVGKRQRTFHPFPVLEFRIVNNRANCAPGSSEIWDAQISAIVQLAGRDAPTDEDDADAGFPSTGRVAYSSLNTTVASMSATAAASTIDDSTRLAKAEATDNASAIQEKVYCPLSLKPDFHPYFSRVWYARHTLDASSPLLRREVRRSLAARRKREGKGAFGWDPALEHYRDIRACLVDFNSIRVTMCGVSALSASDVYAEKVYKCDDVVVGWQFVGICYECDDGAVGEVSGCTKTRRRNGRGGEESTTRVDTSLVHDIVPQRGGDFEPMEPSDES